MTPAQCRAARALIGWTQQKLAEVSGISIATIRRFEAERSAPTSANREALRHALENEGIAFLAHDGVKLVSPPTRD